MPQNDAKQSRILIAGTNSGCGKTTVTVALLAALKKRGIPLSSFKCGPDYIDPMFHRAVLDVPSFNLDPFFCDGEQLSGVLSSHASGFSVIEGVMGYYDGIGTGGDASTWTVAKETKTPVVLVVNVRGMYTSAGAIIKGFKDFRPDSGIAGVIFNGASAMLCRDLAKIAQDAGVKAFGFLPKVPEAEIGSRHLGLITAAEIEDLQQRIDVLAEKAEECIDIDGLLELGQGAETLKAAPGSAVSAVASRQVIAVAKDEAFCFIYQENLELLEAAGFEITYFSPLHDEALPDGISALYLPGGYPELYTEQLSTNNRMLDSVKLAIESGLPTFAECGGFMYLHESIDGKPMAGVIKAKAYRTDRLQRFGYVTLTAQEDGMFCKAGGSIRAHEFHYYESEDPGRGFKAVKPTGKRSWECAHVSGSLYAGFPHLYLPANPQFAESFAEKARQYAENHKNGASHAEGRGGSK